jgi:hypothetical protein
MCDVHDPCVQLHCPLLQDKFLGNDLNKQFDKGGIFVKQPEIITEKFPKDDKFVGLDGPKFSKGLPVSKGVEKFDTQDDSKFFKGPEGFKVEDKFPNLDGSKFSSGPEVTKGNKFDKVVVKEKAEPVVVKKVPKEKEKVVVKRSEFKVIG